MSYFKMDKQKIYQRDVTNFLNYTNENNEDYKKHKLKLVREEDLKGKGDLKSKEYLKGFLTGFFIFLGLVAIAGVIFYNGYYDNFSPSIFLNETLICEGDTLTCPSTPCPACSNNCVCPDIEMPDEINVNLNFNETD